MCIRDRITGDPETSDPLKFWGDSKPGNHILVKRNGVCRNWSVFLLEVICVHGIQGEVIEVSLADAKKFSAFVLKTLDPIPGTILGSGKENRVLSPDDQGHTLIAQEEWPFHAIALINKRYFDPSYGTGPFINPKDYENKSIHALQTRKASFGRRNGSYIGQKPEVADTKFTVSSFPLNK